MATTARALITLLEEAQSGKVSAINEALNLLDAEVGLLDGSNAWTGNNGWYGATPVGIASADQEVMARLLALGFVEGPTYPINTAGGTVTAGAVALSGTLGGSGATAFSLKRFALTFPSDADYTLASGEASSVVIDVQTGVITATRNIIVPGTGAAFYAVINRNAQSVVLKTSGGAGITIPSARARLIFFPTGVNAFALTPSQDYSV